MKKIYYLLCMLPLFALLGSCEDNEEIIFDHEKPMFELKENAILLEVIMPAGTKAEDEIYIAGDFNGGEEAVGNLEWRLEKATGNDKKWGIYLLPSTFLNGKTLADGFYFISQNEGVERSIKNEDVTHTLNVKTGTRTNVMLNRWKSYFEPKEPEEDEHDGFVVYIEDNTGWEALGLYGWGDGGDVTPGWPGLLVTGTKTIGKITYTYFDMGEALNNKGLNLILNNNGGGKQVDGPYVTLDRDYYFRVTTSGWEEVTPSSYTGYTIYVQDNSDWGALAIYGWGDGGDITPGWPGLQVTGTIVINDVTYTYVEVGEALTDKLVNLIFNNNNGGKQFDGPQVTLNRDFYFRITSATWEEVDPNEKEIMAIYIEDKSGWEALAIYGWGDGDVTPGWPGMQMGGTKTIKGVTYKYFEITAALKDKSMNMIFNNNNNGKQFDGPYVTLSESLFFSITESSYTQLESPLK